MVILLTLMTHCQHQGRIGVLVVTVKRQIPRLSTRNDQLSQTLRKRAAYARMARQDSERIKNQVDGFD